MAGLRTPFELEKLKGFQKRHRVPEGVGASKRANKERLADYVKARDRLWH